MKKKYGLDSIIGKKSRIRYPSHIKNPQTSELFFTLPANDAISEPPLNTSITLRKGDPLEFCDSFNEESYEAEEGLPLNVIIHITGGEQIFEIKSPSITSFAGILFDLEDIPSTYTRASMENLLLTAINLSLIKLNPQEDFLFSEIKKNIQGIYGSWFSFNKKYMYRKPVKPLHPRRPLKRYLINPTLGHQILKRSAVKQKNQIKRRIPHWENAEFPALLQEFYYTRSLYQDWYDLETPFTLNPHRQTNHLLKTHFIQMAFFFAIRINLAESPDDLETPETPESSETRKTLTEAEMIAQYEQNKAKMDAKIEAYTTLLNESASAILFLDMLISSITEKNDFDIHSDLLASALNSVEGVGVNSYFQDLLVIAEELHKKSF